MDRILGIGYGVTISDPHIVARMTSALNVVRGDRALEVGTGSGYQSAYLANLTDKVWSIEIIKPLAERTRRLYDSLIERGYDEYKSITTRHADGYYGWEQEAPFDKVIVTCAIDHIPPPLLQQMKPNGMMVIPVGPPGARRYGCPLWFELTYPADVGIAYSHRQHCDRQVRTEDGRPGNDLTYRTSFLFDFPRRVMRDVHGRIAAGTSQCRHVYASKWLTPSDSLVLASAAGDDMRAAIHFRLRLVGVPSIKRRENLIAVAVGQYAGAINVFLFA
jgi:hypothetical protein